MPTAATPTTAVHRVEIRPKPGLPDVRGNAAAAKMPGASAVHAAKVVLLEGPLTDAQISRVLDRLLVDPVVEAGHLGAAPPGPGTVTVEVHPLPGVMDPAAQSVSQAVRELIGLPVAVSTGTRYDIAGIEAERARERVAGSLANPAIHQITTTPWHPQRLPRGVPAPFEKRSVRLLTLDDDALKRLSRQGHLFLTLEEMRALQAHYATLGRDPTDIELETFAQSWSEHCVHKTLKATVRYVEKASRHQGTKASSKASGATVPASIDNLLKSTIARATHELIDSGVDWALSVFKDNSGVIAFDDHWAVNIKVETHNRPSAIEPYGGAATGIGGCIRDVIATGLGSKPIASTDVFCVADPARVQNLPPGVLSPRRILADVVAGVRDYGNRMGIPTVSGGVFFDDRYVGNPLVFCGCIGIMPRALVKGAVRPGDRIIALGGRTGKDGIHGATFSSAEIGHNASTEFAHAVQIGNAIEEKRLLDAILRARAGAEGSTPLYSALTDCGAGGFSSAIGEMAGELGAFVTLEQAPTKYAGLTYTDIWISEAQERIVLAVPAANLPALRRICEQEGVELADLGYFGTPDKAIVLTYAGTEVGRIDTRFLREGLPMPVRQAEWQRHEQPERPSDQASTLIPGPAAHARRPHVCSSLLSLLAHPTIASKHAIIRQYDHEVQGATVLKPLVGPLARGPGDASVIEPVAGCSRGLAISQGLQIGVGDPRLGGDPYQMALAGIDECVRNLVCVGADPTRIAILDNFCWPSCDKPQNMGALVRACYGCYDGAKAYRTPFVSGKDSLSNQLRYKDPATGQDRLIEIPFTLLITGVGIVSDTTRCVSMDAKAPGNVLLLIGETTGNLGGSLYQHLFAIDSPIPLVDLARGPATAKFVAEAIGRGLVRSAHDCSEGGLLVAIAEMLIAGSTKEQPVGADLTIDPGAIDAAAFAFGEDPSRYVLEVSPVDAPHVIERARSAGIAAQQLGTLTAQPTLHWRAGDVKEPVEALAAAWFGTLASI